MMRSDYGRKRTRKNHGPRPVSDRSGWGPAAIPIYAELPQLVGPRQELQTVTVWLGYHACEGRPMPSHRRTEPYRGVVSYTRYRARVQAAGVALRAALRPQGINERKADARRRAVAELRSAKLRDGCRSGGLCWDGGYLLAEPWVRS